MCTGGAYRPLLHDRHFSAASSFQIGVSRGRRIASSGVPERDYPHPRPRRSDKIFSTTFTTPSFEGSFGALFWSIKRKQLIEL
jgi:hypothetical protein